MKTAIITTVYNEASNICSFVESILNQKTLPNTVVLVDGGSTDSTYTKILSYEKAFLRKKVEFFCVQIKCNIAEGRNIAISKTDADVICVTDAGVELDESWFLEITKPFSQFDYVDCVGGNFDIVGNSLIQKSFTLIAYKDKKKNNPSSRSFAFRRDCWLKFQYPENLLVHEDTKLCNEWRRIGFNFFYAEKAIVKWLAEDTIYKIYKKFSNYSKWLVISRDKIDLIRKFQMLTYFFAISMLFFSPLASLYTVSISVLLRVFRQIYRSYGTSIHLVEISVLVCAFLVQITLDLAVIGGFFQGLKFRICKFFRSKYES